ncbi:MAG: type II toxin-antitoxin system HicA family toxin [Terracidiphilus sp.]
MRSRPHETAAWGIGGAPNSYLTRAFERLGYAVIRQKGSHIRLYHEAAPTHSISVPLHDPLKIGTFHGILVEVAQAQSVSIQEILELLCHLRWGSGSGSKLFGLL